MTFDPSSAISSEFGIFGIPSDEKTAALHLLPVPWEVTTSYGKGASDGPQIIRSASEQVDLFDLETGNSWKAGYFMHPISDEWMSLNKSMKEKAQEIIAMRLQMIDDSKKEESLLKEVNLSCQKMTDWVYQQTKSILEQGKLFGLVGGDHSTPLGAIRAVSEKYQGQIGVLHIDAHADLRNAYQGFQQSHASIMHNVMTGPHAPQKLVQLGIRDFCEEEYQFIQDSKGKIKTFFDLPVKRRLLSGETWAKISDEILAELPQKVYISFDIDGLDPALCPHTGTPVAGGLSLDQVYYLFNQVASSGRQIVGFDLNEVSSGGTDDFEWDGNVGARVLYKLCGWSVVTNKIHL